MADPIDINPIKATAGSCVITTAQVEQASAVTDPVNATKPR